MTSAKFYADENVPRRLVEALQGLGHDVLTCAQAGNAGRGIPDEEVLRFATEQGRAVLTMNRKDFFRLARGTGNHAGIVACTVDPDCKQQAARIHDQITTAGDLRGKVIRVNRPG